MNSLFYLPPARQLGAPAARVFYSRRRMRAQRGSRPDIKSQRSVQVRAPTQAQLKSPTWGNEEDDGPTAHPPAVSRYETKGAPVKGPQGLVHASERCPSTSQSAVPAINHAPAAPTALTTAPLDWTTPSCTLPRAPARQGGPTRGGSPLRPRPLPGQRRKHLGSKHNGAHRPPWTKTRQLTSTGIPPSAHGGTVRLNNRDLRRCSGLTTKHPRLSVDQPKGKPCLRSYRARGSLCASHIGSASSGVKHNQKGPRPGRKRRDSPTLGIGQPQSTRAPRRIPPAATTVAHQRKANTARATALVYQTQPQATATSPPAYQTQGRAKAYYRQGNPPRTQSNGSAVCLNNRATPSADRALTGRAAGTPQGSKAASDASKPRLPRECRELAQQCDAKSRASSQGAQQGAGRKQPPHPILKSQRAPPNAQGNRLTANRYRHPWIATPSPPLKQRRRPGKQSAKDNKEKAKKTHLWELNAHVGLGQPRTRHHAQSGRSGHPSVTVPLA
ncbi:hypothetical protein WOLCODRAFT_159260 [Wolfiporia cocos MD-104 SS10]|uniref:Uncharacterized protein n=1 Tax=Wolfiporia cocos (strain MD-104) TaxID=742152 RepID=A0A2H3JCQ6_WOLCO|nr:hypothetical protein WOLCODRAFT_159260 [Wolfiporia cocos MD-104 SS10]